MQLLKPYSNYSCFLDAAAMVCDLTQEQLIEKIGHNGSEVLWPELPSPHCFRGFHLAEILIAMLHFGYAGVFMPCDLYSRSLGPVKHIGHIGYPSTQRGIAIGENRNGNRHAVAFEGLRILGGDIEVQEVIFVFKIQPVSGFEVID